MKSRSFSAARRRRLLFLSYAAIIAALYVVMTVLFGAISFGPFQLRLSEMLTVLPFFTPAAIPGLSIGCFVANLLYGNPFDVVFGTLATTLAAIVSRCLCKNRFLVTLPPVIFNTLTVPLILKFTYPSASGEPIALLMLTVFIGEAIAVNLLGYSLLRLLERRLPNLFKIDKPPQNK